MAQNDSNKSLDELTKVIREGNQKSADDASSTRKMMLDIAKLQMKQADRLSKEDTKSTDNSKDTKEKTIEATRERKGFLKSLKDMFGKVVNKDNISGAFGGIGKTIKKVFNVIKGQFLLIGIAVAAMISQMNMKDLEEMWESFKKAWQGIKKFMLPIIDWFKETVFPATIVFIKEQLERIGKMFEGVSKNFEGFMEEDMSGKFMSILGAFRTIGEFAIYTAAGIMDWGAKLLGYDGSLSTDIKAKWEEWFGSEEGGFLSNIGGIFKSIAGLFILGKIIGGPIGSLLTGPLKIALMGAKGAGGLIGSIAKSIGGAMFGVPLGPITKGLLGVAKGAGILGLAVAVGAGMKSAYDEYEAGGSVKAIWIAGISSFMEVMSMGLLSPDTAKMLSDKIVTGFSTLWDDAVAFFTGDEKWKKEAEENNERIQKENLDKQKKKNAEIAEKSARGESTWYAPGTWFSSDDGKEKEKEKQKQKSSAVRKLTYASPRIQKNVEMSSAINPDLANMIHMSGGAFANQGEDMRITSGFRNKKAQTKAMENMRKNNPENYKSNYGVSNDSSTEKWLETHASRHQSGNAIDVSYPKSIGSNTGKRNSFLESLNGNLGEGGYAVGEGNHIHINTGNKNTKPSADASAKFEAKFNGYAKSQALNTAQDGLSNAMVGKGGTSNTIVHHTNNTQTNVGPTNINAVGSAADGSKEGKNSRR